MAYELVSHRTEQITVDMVTGWLRLPTLPCQEWRFKESRRNKIASLIKAGTFRPASIAIAHVNGNSHVVNGHHTLRAINDVRIPVIGTVEEYRCENKRDVADLFATFDPASSTRGLSDLAGPFATHAGLGDLGKSCVSFCCRALPFMTSHNPIGFSDEEKAALLKEFPDECRFLHGLIFAPGGKAPRHLTFRPIIGAAIMTTWQVSMGAAGEFWPTVRDGNALEVGSPAHTLREWLSALKSKRTPEMQKAIPKKLWCGIGHAWHAYRDGKRMSMVKVYESAPWVEYR